MGALAYLLFCGVFQLRETIGLLDGLRDLWRKFSFFEVTCVTLGEEFCNYLSLTILG